MFTIGRRRAVLRRTAPLALAAAVALLATGCGTASTSGSKPTTPGMSSPSSADGMGGMDMGATPDPTGSAASAGGITAVPTQVLGTAVWQGMKISADAMTPVPFLIYNGTSMQEVKPPKNVSFHLMVLLNDAQTNVVIPYASVWATITKDGKSVFDESLWPMISRYMGPHYGDDVALPGAGRYRLTLLISPPVSARHLEYQDVWLTSHKVTFTFHWSPAS